MHTMDQPDLYPLLHNRIINERQDVPEFIGEYRGASSLPKQDYPAVYFWVDSASRGALRLSFNTPKLRSWCVEEAAKHGISVNSNDDCVSLALNTLERLTVPAFTSTMQALGTDTFSANQKQKSPWWKLW